MIAYLIYQTYLHDCHGEVGTAWTESAAAVLPTVALACLSLIDDHHIKLGLLQEPLLDYTPANTQQPTFGGTSWRAGNTSRCARSF
jgi:hypothetical protein